MTRTIAIIDADICFTFLLISRLRKHLPDFLAFPVSGEVLKNHRNFVLDNEFVLYNQHEITQDEILLHCINEPKPTLILVIIIAILVSLALVFRATLTNYANSVMDYVFDEDRVISEF